MERSRLCGAGWTLLRKFLRRPALEDGRPFASKPRPAVHLDETVRKSIEEDGVKPRKHAGVYKVPPVRLPSDIAARILRIAEDYPAKALRADADALHGHLWGRHPPAESFVIQRISDTCRRLLEQQEQREKRRPPPKDRPLTTREVVEYAARQDRRLRQMVKRRLYNWQAVEYDRYKGVQYLISRAPGEYAALDTIMGEIAKRAPDFRPRTLFDFGSGVGTASWAALRRFEKSLEEIFTVDSSREMNELARFVLCGSETGPPPVRGHFQRQFLPATPIPYDLVVCSCSLFELPSLRARVETILNLWRRTRDFLVIVELGTNEGFRLVEEARAFVLDQKDAELVGHAFAPCPHDLACPRLREDDTPCNFISPRFEFDSHQIGVEVYSYVVLRKGPRKEAEPWPRIVRAPLVRSKHTICRMCSPNGELEEIIFSKGKFDRTTYRCARRSNWGDLLPIRLSESVAAAEGIREPDAPAEDETEKPAERISDGQSDDR